MDNFESICCSDEQRPNLYHRYNYNIDSEINFRRTVYEGGKQELLFGIDIKTGINFSSNVHISSHYPAYCI